MRNVASLASLVQVSIISLKALMASLKKPQSFLRFGPQVLAPETSAAARQDIQKHALRRASCDTTILRLQSPLPSVASEPYSLLFSLSSRPNQIKTKEKKRKKEIPKVRFGCESEHRISVRFWAATGKRSSLLWSHGVTNQSPSRGTGTSDQIDRSVLGN